MDRFFLVEPDDNDFDSHIRNYIIKRFVNRHMDKYLEIEELQLEEYIFNTGIYRSVPVGNLGYMNKALKLIGGERYHGMRPIEVPEVLYPWLFRSYERSMLGLDVKQQFDTGKFFIKNVDTLKSWTNLLYLGSDSSRFISDDTHYSVSSLINIRSEFRVFVLRDECMSIQHYLGDVLELPDKNAIRNMIEDYTKDKGRPKSYTLDVAVADTNWGKQTVVLEVHNFVSCGLYGFYDEKLLHMYDCGWKYELEQLDKS